MEIRTFLARLEALFDDLGVGEWGIEVTVQGGDHVVVVMETMGGTRVEGSEHGELKSRWIDMKSTREGSREPRTKRISCPRGRLERISTDAHDGDLPGSKQVSVTNHNVLLTHLRPIPRLYYQSLFL